MFWTALAGGLAALGAAAGGVALFGRSFLDRLLDRLSRRIFSDPYRENLLEMANVLLKVGPMNLAELELRADSGAALERPFGARRLHSRWDLFFFRPVYLTGRPLGANETVETGVAIGPRAARPLALSIPILIGGMGWGIGLSARAKLALARGAALAGTAANTGGGPFLPAEATEAGKLIFQLNRAGWMREAEILRQADAVEIALGHGALGPAPSIIAGEELGIDPEFRAALAGTRPAVESVLPEGHGAEALRGLVEKLRALTGGVPVGIKIGATDRLEEELAAILSAEPDFIAVDGGEGGTHGLAAALHDAVCLPTLHGLCRAERFLRLRGVRGRLSLLAGGGLSQPADFLKAMALGADAVYIGTAALLALAHGQVEKATPFEPPTALVFHRGARAASFDPERGALALLRYLRSCVAEMELVAKTLGRRSLAEVGREDLCCLDRDLAELAGVRWAGFPPAPEDG